MSINTILSIMLKIKRTENCLILENKKILILFHLMQWLYSKFRIIVNKRTITAKLTFFEIIRVKWTISCFETILMIHLFCQIMCKLTLLVFTIQNFTLLTTIWNLSPFILRSMVVNALFQVMIQRLIWAQFSLKSL